MSNNNTALANALVALLGEDVLRDLVAQVAPVAEAPAKGLRRNAAGRLIDEKGQWVKEAKATKAAPKAAAKKAAPKAKGTKTLTLGVRGSGLIARRSAYAVAEVTGLAQRDIAKLTKSEVEALLDGTTITWVPAATL